MKVITALGKTEFGLPEGFCIYTLQNANGLRVKITNFGAAVIEVRAPDRDGNLADLALGFGDCAGYLENVPSFGVVVGRYANRIANGKFTLDGRRYTLAANHGIHHLHGGIAGFGKKLWRGAPFETREASGEIALCQPGWRRRLSGSSANRTGLFAYRVQRIADGISRR